MSKLQSAVVDLNTAISLDTNFITMSACTRKPRQKGRAPLQNWDRRHYEKVAVHHDRVVACLDVSHIQLDSRGPKRKCDAGRCPRRGEIFQRHSAGGNGNTVGLSQDRYPDDSL